MLALIFLLFVFFIVVMAIVGFIFPPSKWLEWVYKSGRKDNKG